MYPRRTFLSGLGALVAAKPTFAETPAPKCWQTDTTRYGPWTVHSRISNMTAFNKGEEAPVSEWFLESAFAVKRASGFDDIGVTGTDNGEVRLYPLANNKLGAKISMPRPQIKSSNGGKPRSLGNDFLIGRKVWLTFFLDQETEPFARLTDVKTFNDIEISEFSDTFQNGFLKARSMTMALSIESVGTVSANLSTNGLEDARRNAPGLSQTHLNAVKTAGKCEPPSCMMTTAAVHHLNRRDDCFELTQMRRLRQVYADQTHIIDAYLAASRRVLSRPRTPMRTARLLAFYTLVVWPTALLVRLGFYRAARATYLMGFRLFMGPMSPPCPDTRHS